jgi:hypothetical protein
MQTTIQSPQSTHITNEVSEGSRIASTGIWSLSLSVSPPVPTVDEHTEEPERHPYSSPHPEDNTDTMHMSPTESLPLSVSDINFRVDDDDETEYRGSSRHLPRHPPLPNSPLNTPPPGSLRQQNQRQDSSRSGDSTPQAYVAQTSYGRRLVMARTQAQEANQNASSTTVNEERGHSRSRSRSLGFIPFGKKE